METWTTNPLGEDHIYRLNKILGWSFGRSGHRRERVGGLTGSSMHFSPDVQGRSSAVGCALFMVWSCPLRQALWDLTGPEPWVVEREATASLLTPFSCQLQRLGSRLRLRLDWTLGTGRKGPMLCNIPLHLGVLPDTDLPVSGQGICPLSLQHHHENLFL